jgi:DNA primase
MGEILPIEERITQASRRWPGLVFKQTGDEAHSACPFCRAGHDRFVLFSHGSYWCRVCGATGWIDENNHTPLTEAELTEIRLRRLERKQEEHERRLGNLEKMHQRMHIADRYYENLRDISNGAFEYWSQEGMGMYIIDQYKLGYCPACMTDRERRPSYTIPVIIKGKLYNIRHRLVGAPAGDKYRPDMAGLPNVPFNADALYDDGFDDIIILEGEKKSLSMIQIGMANNIAIMGKQGFDPLWLPRFERFRKVTVALDPDATDSAIELAKLFKGRGYIAELPEKIDDMLNPYGNIKANPEDVRWFIDIARRV